jgi:hypothetical protein
MTLLPNQALPPTRYRAAERSRSAGDKRTATHGVLCYKEHTVIVSKERGKMAKNTAERGISKDHKSIRSPSACGEERA